MLFSEIDAPWMHPSRQENSRCVSHTRGTRLLDLTVVGSSNSIEISTFWGSIQRVPPSRKGKTGGGIVRRKSERMNQVWSLDFIFDRTVNGRALKILSIIDEYTRECIALEVNRRIRSEDVIGVLVELFAIRGVPEFMQINSLCHQ